MANVLIVDDDRDILSLVQDVLESAGYHTRIGRNGKEGLQSLASGPLPDCVLLDVDMPVLTGPEMAHEMLLHDAGQEEIPIVLVSCRQDLPRIAARVGTPYFLRKGSANYGESLLALVRRAVTEHHAPTARISDGA